MGNSALARALGAPGDAEPAALPALRGLAGAPFAPSLDFDTAKLPPGGNPAADPARQGATSCVVDGRPSRSTQPCRHGHQVTRSTPRPRARSASSCAAGGRGLVMQRHVHGLARVLEYVEGLRRNRFHDPEAIVIVDDQTRAIVDCRTPWVPGGVSRGDLHGAADRQRRLARWRTASGGGDQRPRRAAASLGAPRHPRAGRVSSGVRRRRDPRAVRRRLNRGGPDRAPDRRRAPRRGARARAALQRLISEASIETSLRAAG